MRDFSDFKSMAQKLRKEGKTYTEIRTLLGSRIPKSTLSHWCSNVNMPAWYQKKVDELNKSNFSKAQKMAWVSSRTKREQMIKNIFKRNKHLIKKADQDVSKMLLAFLYLGEGSKWNGHSGLMLGSSDINIIKLYLQLLKRCYSLDANILKCRISYRADQDISLLEKYWSRITGIPLKNFYKTKPDPRTVGKPTKNRDYKGVCVIMGGGTAIQLELEAIPKIILKGV